jgi:amino acid adenylation domain-containing protein
MSTYSVAGFRVSPQQQHLLSLQQSGPAYRAFCAILIEGPLDEQRLRTSLGKVIGRHEALRTTFESHGEGQLPVQIVSTNPEFDWQSRDVSTDGRQPLDELQWRDVLSDSAGSAPVSASLLRFSETKHVLYLATPSLCADQRSFEIIFAELAQQYSGASSNNQPMQYADFAAWQIELLEGEQAAEGREYWRRHAAATSHDVPVVARGKSESFKRGSFELRIAPDLLSRVEDVARREEVSIEAFMLACWQALLWRMGSEQETEIVTGVVSDGRIFNELSGAIGLYAKALPVSKRMDHGLTFAGTLAETDQALAEARRQQEYFVPGEMETTQSVLFEYAVRPEAFTTSDMAFSLARSIADTAPFALKLYCRREGDSMLVEIQYNAAVSSEADAACLAAPFKALLASAATRPEARIAELDLLDEGERRLLLVDLNDTAAQFPRDVPIHELFERHAARTPEAPAVVFGEERLTYAELNGRANQLARHLRDLGVGPDVRVGVCVERSTEMIVALLAVLKAGAAYLPLDSSYPPERLAFMLEDAAVSALLTQEHLEGELPSYWGPTVLLDTGWDIIASESTENLSTAIEPEQAAYVIYTSGSTGQPKGVVVTHRNLTHSTAARFAYYDRPVGNFILLPSFAFDSSVGVIFWTLASGGALTLVREGQQRDPLQVASLIERHSVTHLLTLPSFYDVLLAQVTRGRLDTLSTVIVAGEACPEGLGARHFEYAPRAALFNEYGPTEATVWSTVHRFERNGRGVPIGQPIQNVRVYIVDARLRPLPNGAEGELYVAGEGLARGYLGQSDLTAARFIPCPFSEEPGARMYHTGDIVRRRGDDNIEFVGRVDQQVKLRGYRIELGEIESLLLQHPAVRECAVVLRETTDGERRLVAYIAGDAVAVTPAELRPYLLARLPKHMLPAAFVRLEALPLTPNGKVNRQALPEPETSRASAIGDSFKAPRTDVEQVIARVWAEVLGVDDVGVEDHFFELGGHSLLVMQVTARIQDIFGFELPPIVAFQSPTVAKLSEALIAHEERPGQVEKIAAIVNRVENLSPEDTAHMLRHQNATA